MKLIISIVLALLSYASANSVVVLTEQSYSSSVAKDFWMIKYFAPWCGHCKRLAPTWESLAEEYSGNANVNVATVDCTVEKSICSEQGVKGYPTLKFFANGKEVEKYGGARSLEALSQFIQQKTGQAPIAHNSNLASEL